MIACYLHSVYLTPCNECIFQAHFLHAANLLYKCSALQISSVINFSNQLCMADCWDFGKLLNAPCDKLLRARQTERKSIKELDNNLQYNLLWRARLLEEKENMITICFHHNHFLGRNLRERQLNVVAFKSLIAVIAKLIEKLILRWPKY